MIFDLKFINNNKNLCKIYYNNELYELKEYFEDIDNNYNHDHLIKFILCINTNITDMSYMFNGCTMLTSISEISQIELFKINDKVNSLFNDLKMNKSNIIEESDNFNKSHKKSLKSSSDKNKSNLNSNDGDIHSSLDISSLKICYIRYIFYECKSLKSLPDISKWNINNVTDMSYVFYN